MTRTFPILRSLASAALLLGAAASGAAAQELRGRDDNPFVWSGRLPAGGTLAVQNVNGEIDVAESPDDRVEVRAEKRLRAGAEASDMAFEVTQSRDGVSICAVYRGRNVCDHSSFNNIRMSVRFSIKLPRSARLRASTGNGEVTVERAGADVEIHTGNGRVRIGETEGRVTAHTGNGDLEVDAAKGPVEAHTGNGRVFVATSSGPVSVHTGNGDIDVRMKALAGAGDMEFNTGSGAIRVTLPDAFSGEIDAATGNGEMRSDFEIRILGRLDPRHLRGTIGNGGRTIRMRTGNGRLEIRKG